MKRIKRILQKDKYGFVRGTVLLGLVLLLIALMFVRFHCNSGSIDAEERAADAAHQVAMQFQVLIEDGFRQMSVVSEAMDGTMADNLEQIDSMVRYGIFSDAVIISDGLEYHLDGSTSVAEAALHYIRYHADDVDGRIIGAGDGTIQLRISVDESMVLAAWIDPERLDRILQSAYTEDYGYAIFNSATGTYLINNSGYSNGGYYDTLLELNADGHTEDLLLAEVAQTHVESARGSSGIEYIAQTCTAIYPWSIALFIPGELLTQEPNSIDRMAILCIIAILLIVSALTAYALIIMRNLRMESGRKLHEAQVAELMLRLSAEESRSRLYVYDRKRDKILAYFDGLKYDDTVEYADAPKNIEELGERCGLSETDAEQLHDRLRELKQGERCDLNLLCSAQDSKHLLRFALNCADSDGSLVLGIMRDCTVEQQTKIRYSDERNFRKGILPRTTSVWQIDFARGRWKVTDCRKGVNLAALGLKLNDWRDYEGDLNGFVREHMHPQDYTDYVTKMSIEFILDMYTRGKFEQLSEFRVRRDGGPYQWYRQVLRVFKNPDTGEIIANLYLQNVDAEKNAEIERKQRKQILQQTLTALGSIYYGLYYVDLDRDLSYMARTHGGELITQLSAPYKATFDRYIQENVHPEDRKQLGQLLDPYNIRKNIREGSHFMRCEYRRSVGDGYEWSAVIVQAARFENATVREVVIALRNISGEKNKDA